RIHREGAKTRRVARRIPNTLYENDEFFVILPPNFARCRSLSFPFAASRLRGKSLLRALSVSFPLRLRGKTAGAHPLHASLTPATTRRYTNGETTGWQARRDAALR